MPFSPTTSGPFYFAWADASETSFNASHIVEDEDVFNMSVRHLEGDFASLLVTIRNPKVGLLNANRKRWCWISWDNNSAVEPLFFGRLIGIPKSLTRELVDVEFLARPEDFAAQKEALANAMRYLPYFDPVFLNVDKLNDPDATLEAQTKAWHIDRLTHVVSTSDLLEGEDGVLTFTSDDDVPYDSVDVTVDQPPIRRVHVEAKVPWTQTVSGTGLTLLRNYKVETIAGKGLIGGWPEVDKDLGKGWVVSESRAGSAYFDLDDGAYGSWYMANLKGPASEQEFLAELRAHQAVSLGVTQLPTSALQNTLLRPDNVSVKTAPPFAIKIVQSYRATTTRTSTGGYETDTDTTYFYITADRVFCDLKLGYGGERKRTDTVTFDLVADSQPIMTEPGDDEVLILNLSGNDVSLPLDTASGIGEIPIGNVARRSYFAQDRGAQSLQYLIQLARAHIVVRSRAVKIRFQVPFETAIHMSLRQNAILNDDRLPGGTAVGKIIEYGFSADNSGQVVGFCTIACAIGYGGAWTALPGTPVYADDGYVEDGYQAREGQRVLVGASDDVAFTPLIESPNDDGLVFPLTRIPVIYPPTIVTIEEKPLVEVQPMVTTQVETDSCGNTTNASLSSDLDTGPYTDWLSGIKTSVDFTLAPIDGGPFDSTYVAEVTTVKLPKQIDLEAI